MNNIDNKNKLSGFTVLALPLIVISTSILTACGGGDGEGADPGIVDYPIAYVNRTYPVDNNDMLIQDDVRDPTLFSAGGDLYVKAIQSNEVAVTTGITQGIGDVKDVDVSYDGTKLVFSLRLADPDPNDQIVPRWNIWEYDLTSKNLTRLIADDNVAERGDDVAPSYLPNGSIVFSSNRQTFSKIQRLNENAINGTTNNKLFYASQTEDRSTIAFMLHTMDSNGENIKQISFNQSHDLDPTVLSNGRIAFSRWDNVANRGSGIHIYSINPDGSDLQLVYGSHSHDTGTNNAIIQYTQPRELTSGNLLTIMRPFDGTFAGGDIVELNSTNTVDRSQSPATTNAITTDGTISPGGRYSSAFPLWDGSGRMIVSKGLCQIMVGGTPRFCIEPYISDATATEIPPAYGVWLYDRANNAEKPLVQAQSNRIITDVVATQPRTAPDTYTPPTSDNNLPIADGMGLLHIRSVYDMDGTYNDFGTPNVDNIQTMANSNTPAANRPARFLRILKTIGMPDPDDPTINAPDLMNTAFGRDRNLGMREIIGYAPIEPDGSVMVKVPANIPLTIEVLNSRGVRIGDRHQTWISVAAGETRSCNGCHTHPNTGNPLPHGRSGIGAAAVHQGAGTTIAIPLPDTLGTVATIFASNGETMAQARYNRCVIELAGCGPVAMNFDPTVNMMYEDVWAKAPNAPFNYLYSDLTTTIPASAECQILNPGKEETGKWTKECRTTINYRDHIEPLWTVARTVNAADATCTTCHNTRNGANAVQVPAGQLNLTNVVTDYPATFIPNPDQVDSYRELYFNSTQLELNAGMTALIDTLVDSGQVDANNNPILVTVNVSPSMQAAGARFGRFMTKLTTTMGTVDHTGFLTDAELRLVAEWADIGGQYYNDPFDPNAPQN